MDKLEISPGNLNQVTRKTSLTQGGIDSTRGPHGCGGTSINTKSSQMQRFALHSVKEQM